MSLRSWSPCLCLALASFLVAAIVGCADATPTATTTRTAAATQSVNLEGSATVAETVTLDLPTLLPTQTRSAVPTPRPSLTPAPTPTPTEPFDFEQIVVEFRYRIPAIALDRRVEGNVSGQVTVVDETAGLAVFRRDQTLVLLEMQRVLPRLELEELPEGCTTCVAFSYELPLEGESGEGWLQDPVLLASIEHYTADSIGPHFPPDTVLGLRRNATAYDVAHSLALTSSGELWRWRATAPDIDEATAADAAAPDLEQLAAAITATELEDAYLVQCPGLSLETLYLSPEEADALSIQVFCPAFSLPTSLLPVYVTMDALLQETLAGHGLERPPLQIPLATILHYGRADGATLNVLLGNRLQGIDVEGNVYTGTISSGQRISLTTRLVASEELAPGVALYEAGETDNILLVRGSGGMLEAGWDEEMPPALPPVISELDALLDALLLGDAPAAPTASPTAPPPAVTPTPTPAATP